MPITSKNDGHVHLYTKGAKFTRAANGHRHPIRGKKALKGFTNHTHRLL